MNPIWRSAYFSKGLGKNHQESLYSGRLWVIIPKNPYISPISTMGTLLGVHPIVPWVWGLNGAMHLKANSELGGCCTLLNRRSWWGCNLHLFFTPSFLGKPKKFYKGYHLPKTMWMFPKIRFFYPQIIHVNRVFHMFSIINHPFWGIYPYFWKHPCEQFSNLGRPQNEVNHNKWLSLKRISREYAPWDERYIYLITWMA